MCDLFFTTNCNLFTQLNSERFFKNLTQGKQGDKAEKIAQIIINFQIFPFIYKFIFHGL